MLLFMAQIFRIFKIFWGAAPNPAWGGGGAVSPQDPQLVWGALRALLRFAHACTLFSKICSQTTLSLWPATPLFIYTYTGCPTPGCSGIRAPLNFCCFAPVAPLSSSLPDRSLNPQITLFCFELQLASKKKPFSNGKAIAPGFSSLGGSLAVCFSKSSPCRAETGFFTSLCSLCHSFNPSRWPAASL